ncbi:hypothetical protein Tsubulata_016506 [Turnera subulata]|uniref:Malectin-like domain-containing protein n=1 Tax=Turnera subulata TaxID=218843 RepID=A0A9Q0G0J7_9ROSI|nr:hypothetical protein Tsubulata_016506 [Turnera subulata]
MSPSLLFFLLLFFFFFSSAFSSPFNVSYHIDCGSAVNTTDPSNITWLSDRFYSSGAAAIVSEPLQFTVQHEKTLRYFPLTSGKKNCYTIPLPPGRYYVRTFTVYDNYDGHEHPPAFEVSIEGTIVYSWGVDSWPLSVMDRGAYSDLFAFVEDGEADLCFYSIATDAPLVGSLSVRQVDPLSYDSAALGGPGHVLVNYGRVSTWPELWGPGFSSDTDSFGRTWDVSDRLPKAASSDSFLTTREKIANTEQAPNYLPMKLFQRAYTPEAQPIDNVVTVDPRTDYLVWFHFAEIDPKVTKKGQRVLKLVVNGENVSTVDIFDKVGSFAAYSVSYKVSNLTDTVLAMTVFPLVGKALICGFEVYAVVPRDFYTEPAQAMAMKALKESLRVPDRMGWNGDPCAPTKWDAWEGVTCRVKKNESTLVISQIDVGSQGLRGSISDQIGLLTDLVSLNLSRNALEGILPSGLGVKALRRLDLSHNMFKGPIPESLTASSLQLVLLNDNFLEGRVPEELYSIGVRGGAIDLSGNKGLCGVPSLPQCPLLWENGGLSTAGKIGLAVSGAVLLVLLLLLYVFCIRRRRNDYDFAPTHDLMSMAAKRNRYQRQKSLMVLEMESQHAKGLPSPYGPQ